MSEFATPPAAALMLKRLDDPQLQDTIMRLRRLVASLRFAENESAARTREAYRDALHAALQEQMRRDLP
jgi:hypothetical protein